MTVLHGDCREAMRTMPDNSVDAIITDPPYELGFMGKSWDSTGIAYDVTVWQECLRVLKPGGHLLAFGGSRTYHRLACAIEDAGFQIRDQIMWVYGSGFPKSLNIGKAIDKAAGAEREVVQTIPDRWAGKGQVFQRATESEKESVSLTTPATPEAEQWDGWGTALKPAHEPIVMARKPLEGTVAQTVLTHGTGGINIDGCRVESPDKTKSEGHFRKGNVIGDERTSVAAGQFGDGAWVAGTDLSHGRFPANFIHDGSDEVLELFPNTKSGGKNVSDIANTNGLYRLGFGGRPQSNMMASSGSAARFFYCAKASQKDRNEGLDEFQPKRDADRIADNGVGGDNPRNRSNTPKLNHHPTVKPTDLMRYLCRLITPPNGTILDPFTGSGSTGKAATLEGFNFIGIEQSAEYVEIATARINHAKENNEN